MKTISIGIGVLVMVEWEDPSSECDWISFEDLKDMEPTTCIEVGWLMYKDKYKIVVTSQSLEGDYGNRTVIPIALIESITVLSIKSSTT